MRLFMTICAAALTFCGAASAQFSQGSIKVHFDRPVIAGTAELAAGDYTIRALPTGGNLTVMVRSDSGGRAILLVNPLRVQRPEGNPVGVVLGRRGGQYVLEQVWLSPDIGYELL